MGNIYLPTRATNRDERIASMKEVIMPKLGQTVEVALIERWHKKEGDTIEKGEVLLEITTDKATLEVESFYSGTIRKALYQEGESVPVNSIIAFIGEPDEAIPEIPLPVTVEKKISAASQSLPAAKPARGRSPFRRQLQLHRHGMAESLSHRGPANGVKNWRFRFAV